MRTKRLAQRELAKMAGVSRQAIGTWLTGETVPRGDAVRRLATAMDASPQWLLLGQGSPPPELPYDEGADFMTQLANASEFISPLMAEYQRLLKDSERHSESVKRKMRDLSRRWHRTVREVFESTLGGTKKDLRSKGKPLDISGMKTPLTLSELLSRVRNATRKQGDKKKLAAKLNIKPQQLSQWLSGDYEPGGEYTLKLMKWVASKEAQQKQSVEGAQTPPTRQTRFRSSTSSHEKPKSDQHGKQPSRKRLRKRR